MFKNKKSIAKIAIIGASMATAAALISNILSNKDKKKPAALSDNNTTEDADDFDIVDFASLGNDSTREYVSIKISEHKESDTDNVPIQES